MANTEKAVISFSKEDLLKHKKNIEERGLVKSLIYLIGVEILMLLFIVTSFFISDLDLVVNYDPNGRIIIQLLGLAVFPIIALFFGSTYLYCIYEVYKERK